MTIRLDYYRHGEHWRARAAVREAVAQGKLPSASHRDCVQCDGAAEQYHHHLGYSRQHWLAVVPLCRSCHYQQAKRERPRRPEPAPPPAPAERTAPAASRVLEVTERLRQAQNLSHKDFVAAIQRPKSEWHNVRALRRPCSPSFIRAVRIYAETIGGGWPERIEAGVIEDALAKVA